MKLTILLIIIHFGSMEARSFLNPQNNACSSVRAYHVAALSSKCRYNPDISSNITNIAQRHGYNIQTFSLITDDGYIINMFRIRPKSNNVTNSPVFIMHGILIDAESWVSTGNRSLAFNLADKQYDVWVGTLRGTSSSNKHVNLNVNDPDYWNFNLDTLTDKDFNDQLSFIANKTQKKVLLIGHSMGTTLSFMYASTFGEKANQIVEGIVAFAPVVYLTDVVFTQLVIPWGIPLIDFLEIINIKGLLYREDFVHSLEITICRILPEICFILLSTGSGETNHFAPDDLLLFLSYWPGGTSIYQIKHFLQIAASGRFQKYDYGKNGNLKNYGTTRPPLYNLTNIQVPVFLFYGENDLLYKQKNLEKLYNEIGSTTKQKLAIPPPPHKGTPYSHIDFVYAKNITKDLYDNMYNLLNLYLQ